MIDGIGEATPVVEESTILKACSRCPRSRVGGLCDKVSSAPVTGSCYPNGWLSKPTLPSYKIPCDDGIFDRRN